MAKNQALEKGFDEIVEMIADREILIESRCQVKYQ